jgi:hypothetical protein
MSVDEKLIVMRQQLRQSIERSFIQKRRLTDFRLLFQSVCRRTYPTLRILWATKDVGPLKLLLKTYPPQTLHQMVVWAFEHPTEVFPNGVSFLAFYQACPLIAQRLSESEWALSKQREMQESMVSEEGTPATSIPDALRQKMPASLRERLGL